MAILKIDHIPDQIEIEQLTQEFPDYIKLTADVEQNILYGGSRLHADAERILLEQGSLQKNIWGGGINLKTKQIECYAVLNIRPDTNPDPLILDQTIRDQFIRLVKIFFSDYYYGSK